ncbi:MAG: hypothetical protein VKN56_10710 [Cyanobacteriota bacterium]|nr:hypothetical protein [Cyanobacteriota bacterium]
MASDFEAGQPDQRIIIAAPPRCGTTLLASVLSNLGVRFGLEDRSWNIDSGYYEHPSLLKVYETMRKWHKLRAISDNASDYFFRQAVNRLRRLLVHVQAIKYPPLSSELPQLVDLAGYRPLVVIVARRFQSYALSRMKKESVDWEACRRDYINIYNSSLVSLRNHGGVVVCYEDLFDDERNRWMHGLSGIVDYEHSRIEAVLDRLVSTSRNQPFPELADAECDLVYGRLRECRAG